MRARPCATRLQGDPENVCWAAAIETCGRNPVGIFADVGGKGSDGAFAFGSSSGGASSSDEDSMKVRLQWHTYTR